MASPINQKIRWQKENENFRKQIKHFQAETAMTIDQIAARCNISRGCLYNYLNDCTHLEKVTERYLKILFEEHNMRYDPTMGEGAQA